MAFKILQINFKYSMSAAEYKQAMSPEVAGTVAAVPGVCWKTWLLNDAQHEAGGIYLFEDDATLQAFLASPIVAGVKSNPALSNFSAKVFDVMLEQSAVTRAPIPQGMRV
jgi:hypothetical protein